MLRKISQIAHEAGRIMLSFHDAGIHQKDGHCNFVTDADIAVQKYLKERLLALIPGSRFFAEEQQNEPLSDDATFVVDPIDGTLNFMRGRNTSAISIALLNKRQPVLGVILNPYTEELFTAEEGKGAHLNGKAISVSMSGFDNAIVSFGTSPYDSELARRTLRIAEQFLQEAGDLRRTGSAALDLCDVACGRADIFYELRLRPWDVAAGSLIVKEAGGRFVSLGKDRPYFDSACGVLAANVQCAAKAMEIISKALQ